MDSTRSLSHTRWDREYMCCVHSQMPEEKILSATHAASRRSLSLIGVSEAKQNFCCVPFCDTCTARMRHIARHDLYETSDFIGLSGGHARNRTGVYGFAVRCVTTPPRGLPERGRCVKLSRVMSRTHNDEWKKSSLSVQENIMYHTSR